MPVLIFVFIAVLLAGVPVFIALAFSSLLYTHFIAHIPDFVILHRMAGGLDSFPLLAVPFFILAGNLMNSAGITNRIYDFAVATCGWMRGGLAHVNIFGSVIFAGMSGTAIADAAGLGTIEIKAMQDHGYDTEFSVGVTAASATLGPIIPPSLPFVIYGMMGNVSIGALFLGGFIPGAVMTIFMMLYVSYCARRYGMGADQAFRWITLGRTFIAAMPALLTPAIIIGGMTFGWFTFDRSRRFAVRMGADDDAADGSRRRGAAEPHRQQIHHPVADQRAAAGRRLLPRADRLDQHSGAGADADPPQGRHPSGSFRRGDDAQSDDRIIASAARHGAVRAVQDSETVDRADHHGDPAVADSAPDVADRDYANSRTDAVASAAGGDAKVVRVVVRAKQAV